MAKITNIAIVENKDKGQLFVSMPRYKIYCMHLCKLYQSQTRISEGRSSMK